MMYVSVDPSVFFLERSFIHVGHLSALFQSFLHSQLNGAFQCYFSVLGDTVPIILSSEWFCSQKKQLYINCCFFECCIFCLKVKYRIL
jgi:hypothetical protein